MSVVVGAVVVVVALGWLCIVLAVYFFRYLLVAILAVFKYFLGCTAGYLFQILS